MEVGCDIGYQLEAEYVLGWNLTTLRRSAQSYEGLVVSRRKKVTKILVVHEVVSPRVASIAPALKDQEPPNAIPPAARWLAPPAPWKCLRTYLASYTSSTEVRQRPATPCFLNDWMLKWQ